MKEETKRKLMNALLILMIPVIPLSIYDAYQGDYGGLLVLIGICLIEFTNHRNRKE